MRNILISFLAGILFCWFLLNPLVYKLTHPLAPRSYKDIVITKVTNKTDTVFIPNIINKTITLRVPVATVVDTTIIDTLRMDSYAKKRYAANFTRKVYEGDSQVVKDVTVGYKADVTGILNGMELSYTDRRPKIIVKDSIFTETTITQDKSSGLYLGVGGTSNLRYLGPHVMYIDRQGNAFRAGVNALSIPKGGIPEVSLGYSKRLFGKQ